MHRRAVAVSSALPKLVAAFEAAETSPGPGLVWTLSERINRAVATLGPDLRHFSAAEGSYVVFTTCRRKHGLIGYDGAQWVLREGSGRPRRGDLETALTFLTSALECAVAGSVKSPADAFFEDIYKVGEPTAEPGELVLFDYVILNLEPISDTEIYLGYIYVPPEARGSGAGSKTLQLVADLADRHCVTVALKARSFRITDPYSRELDKTEGPNLVATEALVKLYQRFGFRGEARYMERVPRCTLQRAARYRSASGPEALLQGLAKVPLYHRTNGPRAAKILLYGEGLKAASGFSSFGRGNVSGVSTSTDLGWALSNRFSGDYVFVLDAADFEPEELLAYDHRAEYPEEAEVRVLRSYIGVEHIRALLINKPRIYTQELAEHAETGVPLLYRDGSVWKRYEPQRTAQMRTAKWERYDIAATAARLNREVFGGELDLSFPMHYRALKPVYGLVRATANTTSGTAAVKELAISSRYQMDLKTFESIVLHELIHVYMLQSRKWRTDHMIDRSGHGPLFRQEVARVKAAGYDCPLSEDVGNLALDVGKPFSSPVFVAVIDGTSMVVFRRIDSQEVWDRFLRTLRYNRRKKLELFQTTNPAVRELPIAQSLRTTIFKRYKLLPDLYAALQPDLVSATDLSAVA